ncbi:MAG: signal peptidase II [Micavibrio sp.]
MKLDRSLLIVLLIFVADQVSKWWVVEQIMKSRALPTTSDASAMPFLQWLITAQDAMPFVKIEILPFFNLVMVWNKGVSFGLFNSDSDFGPMLLILLAAVIVVVFGAWLARTKKPVIALSLSLIIGGALGNVIDRIRFQAVADFLDFHAFGFHWPAFNIADSAITIGIGILLIYGLFFEPKHKEATPHA